MDGNGQYDQGEEQTDEDGDPLDEDACDLSPMLTWGQAFFPEPPSTQVFTDEFGLKYWKILFYYLHHIWFMFQKTGFSKYFQNRHC